MTGDRVECRSDHDYIGYPRAFYWQDQHLEVAQVIQEKRTPTGHSFLVRTTQGDHFLLNYEIDSDQWSVQPI
jgi:hypothetical protein